MKKLICHFASVAFMRPFGTKRLVYMAEGERPPSIEDERIHARETAKGLEPDIKKRADVFVEKLDSMTEEELSKTDISKLADEAKNAIDASISAKPLKLKGGSISDKWLDEGPRKIIVDARTEAFTKIDAAKATYEHIKATVNDAIYTIQRAEDHNSSINKNIHEGFEKVDIIFRIGANVPATTEKISSARRTVNQMSNDVTVNVDAIGRMRILADGLATSGLTIGKAGVERIEKYIASASKNNDGFKDQVNVASQYVGGLEMGANANGKQDATLFDKAKAMRESAKKQRAALPVAEIEIGEDEMPYAISDDPLYGPERSQEKQKEADGKPLPEVSNGDAERVIKLEKGSSTSILLEGKNITISRNSNGEYELPDGSTAIDGQKALFSLRMQAWKEKYPEDDKKKQKSNEDSSPPSVG